MVADHAIACPRRNSPGRGHPQGRAELRQSKNGLAGGDGALELPVVDIGIGPIDPQSAGRIAQHAVSTCMLRRRYTRSTTMPPVMNPLAVGLRLMCT